MNQSDLPPTVSRVVLLGNHLPRHCGIATFTTDLADAIAAKFPDVDCGVIAVNDPGRSYAYGERVRFQIAESDLTSFRRAADFLNIAGVDVLSLQHEYGIFGGKAGSHVLSLLGEVRMPIVTTLHTILREPSDEQRRVMDEVTRLSSRVVVMSAHGRDLLAEVHDVPSTKIDVIPHGIPILPNRKASKKRLKVEGTLQLLTFGLLSPDKGIEYVIDALPAVVARHPSVVYVVVGATHPHVKQWHGEAYRRQLQLRAHKLGVDKHVVFHDRFVSASELAEFLSAADVYLTPYLNPEQSTSGTLAYAVGTGKAVISTPYVYARELLAGERGILVPMRNSEAMATALISLLDDPVELEALGARAVEFGRNMSWPAVAEQYLSSFERAHAQGGHAARPFFVVRTSTPGPIELPELSLQHLRTLTDDTGILQHAVFTVARYQDGYCLDDNARALLLTTVLQETGTSEQGTTRALGSRYLAFLSHAFNPELGRFRNFMAYTRHWAEASGSDDSHARALWALGVVAGRARDPGVKGLASELFHAALPEVMRLTSPRAWAFVLLGIHEYLSIHGSDREAQAFQASLAERLLSSFARDRSLDWPWGEDILTYENARLPQALIVSGKSMGRPDMLTAGLDALRWLSRVQTSEQGYFAPIGSNGFYAHEGNRALFDQQPVEACATVSACLDAWRVTREDSWVQETWRAFSWFLGENQLNASLYDPLTGGCRDGLHIDRVNENQGAESTLSFLLALTDMTSLDSEMRLQQGAVTTATSQRRRGSE